MHTNEYVVMNYGNYLTLPLNYDTSTYVAAHM